VRQPLPHRVVVAQLEQTDNSPWRNRFATVSRFRPVQSPCPHGKPFATGGATVASPVDGKQLRQTDTIIQQHSPIWLPSRGAAIRGSHRTGLSEPENSRYLLGVGHNLASLRQEIGGWQGGVYEPPLIRLRSNEWPCQHQQRVEHGSCPPVH